MGASEALTINLRDRILHDAALGLPGRFTDFSLPKVFYVSKGGHDGNPGTRSHPLLTIQNAVDRAVSGRGDIINIAPTAGDAYQESVTVDKAGLTLRGFVRGGQGNGTQISTAALAAPGIIVTAVHVQIENISFISPANQPGIRTDGNYTTIDNCFFTGVNQTTSAGVISTFGAPNIRRCIFAFLGVGVGFRKATALFGANLEDLLFKQTGVADIATLSSDVVLGSTSLSHFSARNLFHISKTVTDYINLSGTMTDVVFFDSWFSRTAADAGTLELPAGVIVLGRDPAGLVNVTGV